MILNYVKYFGTKIIINCQIASKKIKIFSLPHKKQIKSSVFQISRSDGTATNKVHKQFFDTQANTQLLMYPPLVEIKNGYDTALTICFNFLSISF